MTKHEQERIHNSLRPATTMSKSAFLVVAILSILHFTILCQSQFLYVSFHGGKSGNNNIYKYDLQGNLVQKKILDSSGNQEGLRSMARNPANPEQLYVANSKDSDSRVLLYSACGADGTRTYLSDFVSSASSNQIQHPYGLAFGTDFNGPELYVSSQNINLVTSYSAVNGVFSQVIDNINPDEVRGLAFHNATSTLYIADKDANQMIAFNVIEGVVDPANTLSASDPISMYIDANTDLGYISSAGDNSILVYNLNTHTLIHTLTDPNLSHPAGSVVVNNTLYVIDQDSNGILAFNLNTWTSMGLIVSNFSDSPEQIIDSDC